MERKLVRDKIPQIANVEVRVAERHEMVGLLIEKLAEEVREVERAEDIDALSAELCDCYEVVHRLSQELGLDGIHSIASMAANKARRRGCFNNNYVMEPTPASA